jgi:predicted nucleic acid-binding protein
MQTLDASSIIYAWDNYPDQQFPSLWRWLALQMEQVELTIPAVALAEVVAKSPICGAWLKAADVQVLQENIQSLQIAANIQTALGVVDGKYGDGVGDKDIRIIAVAKVHAAELLTNEKRQPGKPAKLLNYKIPAVCDLAIVSVLHLDFLDYIKRSGQVFS